MMKNKTILLVGGCGFIGHNLAIKLKKMGYEPVVVDSLQINNILSIKDTSENKFKLNEKILKQRIDLLNENKIRLFIQDSRDYNSITRLYKIINPSKIFHLAAVSHANESIKNPHNTFDHSLRTLENTLDFARGNKIHVIYLSSSMVYGNFNERIVDEDSQCDPLEIYGSLKLAGELIVKAYQRVYDLPFTIIRPSALYGERCVSRRVGQIFIESAINKEPLKISEGGQEKLDFTYIDDFIEGLSRCCEYEEAKNQIFNLTFGNGRQIIDLIKILENNFPNIIVENVKRDKLIPKRGSLSIEKAKKFLKYSPKYDLETGYQKYIDWYKSLFKIQS